MPRFAALALAVVWCATAATAVGQEDNKPPEQFVALFNGTDLSGWYGLGHFDPRKLWAMSDQERIAKRDADMADVRQHWRVENGELVNDGHGVYLTTDREFRDFELWIDYKTVAKADSGIYLRGTPQVQIWDYTEAGGKWNRGADKGSGGLYNNRPDAPGRLPLVLADKPFGQWNQFRITQIGSRTTVLLNGQLVVDNAIMENYWDKDRSTPLRPRGPIHLQTHGGEIRWRNIFVREIPADEANRRLRGEDAAQGFQPVFDGRDLTGWAGAVVIDDTAQQYAKLDPRQFHGSSYGMVAAHRGYLRPVGQWNYQQVTVQGSTITVELNGTVILNADLSKVTEFKDNWPHPGKDRTRGHFGFAGHQDPVLFRNIAVKRLTPAASEKPDSPAP